MRAHWLMKSEPDEVSIDDLANAPGHTLPWTGVRNYQARNFMRDAMQPGDGVLFYHSSCPEPGIAGLARIVGNVQPDATQFDPASPYADPKSSPDKPRWLQIDVALLRKTRLLSLREMRNAPQLASMQVLQRGNRLSITPVTPTEWQAVLALLRHPGLNLEPLLIVELLALGVAGGFLAGLLGVGGGMTMVPFLTAIVSHRGVPPAMAVKIAIATSMATILFTSLSSLRAHHKLGAVRWDLVRGLAPGIVVGGLLSGAGAFAVLKGQGLALCFAVFIGYSALQMLRGRKPTPGRQMPGAMGQGAAGGVIGFVSGLLGAGGAFISVPFMVWCNVPIRQAVGTSAAIGFPVAAAATAGYVISGWSVPSALPGVVGYLFLPALAVVATASVLLAPVGAAVAQRMDTGRLRRVFALMLLALAATWPGQGLRG